MSGPDETYPARAGHAAISAIVDLYGDESGRAGVVEPEGAIEGLCLAIAMIAHNTGMSQSPTARRELADRCRKLVLETQNNIARAVEAGTMPEWLAAQPVPRRN